MHDDPADLAKVPPHRRPEVMRRIAVVERYLANRSGPAAIAAAADLGMGQTAFYALVKAWSERRSAIDLPGAGGPRAGHHGLSREQMDVISTAAAEMPGAIIERVAERAVELARERDVAMVGWAAITKHVGNLLVGRLPDNSPASSADLVLEHCVIDMPAGDPSAATATMPIATIITRVADARIVGVALSPEAPTPPAAARALWAMLAAIRPAPTSGPLRMYMHSLTAPGWAELRHAVEESGVSVISHISEAVSPPNATIRLVGRKVAGIRLMPRLGRRPSLARPASIESGGRPLALAEAEELLIARWTPPAGEVLELPMGRPAISGLSRALSAIMGER